MSETYAPLVPPPPPPPPQKSRVGLIIGIVAGALVLCLCCAILGGVIYTQRKNIPFVSSLFPTPTPVGVLYSNPAVGISLYYPPSWVYQDDETSSTVFLATSQAVLDANSFPEGEAAMVLFHSATIFNGMPDSVDTSSPEEVLKYMVSDTSGFFPTGASEYEPVRAYSIQGNPAASAVYTITDSGTPYNWYVVFIAFKDVPVLAVSISSTDTWASYRPTFDGILNSIGTQPIQ